MDYCVGTVLEGRKRRGSEAVGMREEGLGTRRERPGTGRAQRGRRGGGRTSPASLFLR